MRGELSKLLNFSALVLVALGMYWWSWPWYANVATVISGILLGVVAVKLEPRVVVRTPRGGPMDDPEKTLSISDEIKDSRNPVP